MPSISVVIPAYNCAAFIRRTIESVWSQSLMPAEIIVVDDASSDGETEHIVESMARHSPVPLRPIRLSRNSGGPAAPLNAGIEAAQGDLIATLDHDDAMTPNRLADQAAAVDACPGVGLVIGRVKGCDQGDEPRADLAERGWAALRGLPNRQVASGIFRVAARDAYRALLTDGCYAITCSALLFPRDIWRKVGGFTTNIRTACDYDFIRSVTRDHDLAFVDSVIARWSDRPETLFCAGGLARRLQDQWLILDRYRTDHLPAELRPDWLAAARRFLFDGGFQLREAGFYREALKCYFRLARACGCYKQALWATLKLGTVAILPQRRAA